jgi:hypothetical protein
MACQALRTIHHPGHLVARSLLVGTRSTCQPSWSTRRGWVTKNSNQCAHDSDGSMQPLISSITVPRNQWCSFPQRMEYKAANEIPSLVSLSWTPFHVCKNSYQPRATTQSCRPGYIPALGGYLDFGESPPRIVRSFACILKSLEVHSNYRLRTTKVLRTAMLGKTDKNEEKMNKR